MRELHRSLSCGFLNIEHVLGHIGKPFRLHRAAVRVMISLHVVANLLLGKLLSRWGSRGFYSCLDTRQPIPTACTARHLSGWNHVMCADRTEHFKCHGSQFGCTELPWSFGIRANMLLSNWLE